MIKQLFKILHIYTISNKIKKTCLTYNLQYFSYNNKQLAKNNTKTFALLEKTF